MTHIDNIQHCITNDIFCQIGIFLQDTICHLYATCFFMTKSFLFCKESKTKISILYTPILSGKIMLNEEF